MKPLSFIVTIGLLILMGCVANSRIGFDDKKYFQEPPKIVTSGNRFFLRWVYADDQQPLFAMFSESKIMKDSLFFFIPVTTSSGRENGKVHLEEIIDSQKLVYISQNRAFWRNPNGSLNVLKVAPMSHEEF
jgi:hypothetical protein